MSNKLKIYACSGVGSADTDNRMWDYWTDNTNSVDNTQAVNTLLALINRNYIEVTRLRSMTDAQRIANLNDIDIYVVCLQAAQKYAQHYTKLQHAGAIIGGMVANGDFNYPSLDLTLRDKHLDELLAKFEQLYASNDTPVANPEFIDWFSKTIIDRNKVGFGNEERAAIKKAVSGIGASKTKGNWQDNEELSKYLSNGSEYFLYTYFTDAQLNKLPDIFRIKRIKQRKTYNDCKAMYIGIYGSEAEMQEVIRAGIINYFGETPESVCNEIVAGKRTIKSVGDFGITEIVALISAITTSIVAIIAAIGNAVAKCYEIKYKSMTTEEIDASVPTESDYAGFGASPGSVTTKKSSWLLWVLLGVGGWLLLRKR